MHLGYCSPLEVRCLLEGAKALVYPSKFEGFGLPVAEAIILGTPVVCSNIDTLKEVGGDAVVTFDPTDRNDIVRAVEKVLMDPRTRDTRSAKAQKRKSLFAAGPIALKTFNLYRELCGQKQVDQGPELFPRQRFGMSEPGIGAAKLLSTWIVANLSRAGSL